MGTSDLGFPGTSTPSSSIQGRLFASIQRFTQKMNTIPCIKQELVIASFHANVRTVRMCEKLSNHQVESTRELWELADRCARMDEGAKFRGDDEPEDEAAPNKNKKRTTGSEKRVFVTEPLPKKAKPVSASNPQGSMVPHPP